MDLWMREKRWCCMLQGYCIELDWCTMQRSRKALQERRAIEKAAASGRNCLYKISLSLVFVLWGLVFLFSLWISRGHGYRGIFFVFWLIFMLYNGFGRYSYIAYMSLFCYWAASKMHYLAYVFFSKIDFVSCSLVEDWFLVLEYRYWPQLSMCFLFNDLCILSFMVPI